MTPRWDLLGPILLYSISMQVLKGTRQGIPLVPGWERISLSLDPDRCCCEDSCSIDSLATCMAESTGECKDYRRGPTPGSLTSILAFCNFFKSDAQAQPRCRCMIESCEGSSSINFVVHPPSALLLHWQAKIQPSNHDQATRQPRPTQSRRRAVDARLQGTKCCSCHLRLPVL